MQFALGSSNSSSSKTKIISLIHALNPISWGKSAFNAKLKLQVPLPKTTKNILKLNLPFLTKSYEQISKDFLKIEDDLAEIIC